jgi:hypothetical protein
MRPEPLWIFLLDLAALAAPPSLLPVLTRWSTMAHEHGEAGTLIVALETAEALARGVAPGAGPAWTQGMPLLWNPPDAVPLSEPALSCVAAVEARLVARAEEQGA